MLPSEDLAAIASQLDAAHADARQVEPPSADFIAFDVESAYAAAALQHRRRLDEGRRPAGRKLGFTNAAMWARYGVNAPLWAWLYEDSVSQLASNQAVCGLVRFAEPKIEPEIVLGLREAPPPGAADDPGALLGCVEWVAHGFEVVQCHYPGWRFEAADAVVDQVLHAALFVGERVPVAALGADPLAALEGFSVELRCDGEPRETGHGRNVLGSPLLALAHLLRLLQSQPGAAPLQPGEIVTTGTLTSALPVALGQRWETRLDGIALPGLALDFTA
ncbi:2-keto-4-pentenoate hydratase [Azohydromonas aeria]|uniref:2-keto-4-pentenoate hydratase n=1 Tax=Azohydromonas aeria TaxID=2590212 RepID=UPI0012F7BC36|nr:decarboxylase [Azohydromonas aeria]